MRRLGEKKEQEVGEKRGTGVGLVGEGEEGKGRRCGAPNQGDGWGRGCWVMAPLSLWILVNVNSSRKNLGWDGMAGVKGHRRPGAQCGMCGICFCFFPINKSRLGHCPNPWEPLHSDNSPRQYFARQKAEGFILVRNQGRNHNTVMISVQQWEIG